MEVQVIAEQLFEKAVSESEVMKKAAITYAYAAGLWKKAMECEGSLEEQGVLLFMSKHCESLAKKLGLSGEEVDEIMKVVE